MDIKDIESVFSEWNVRNEYFGFTSDIVSVVLEFKKNKKLFNKLMFIPICIAVISFLRVKSSPILKSVTISYKDKRIRYSRDALRIVKSVKEFQKEGNHRFVCRMNDIFVEILLDHDNVKDVVRKLIKEDLWEIDETIIVNIVDYIRPDIKLYCIEIEKKTNT